ncbi:uncharacterized protein BKCO1_3200042 [Diplodia corticola]|uniref:Uncharacterized protein n=1 Tax=Diplodia corticola TaxID=236234 RepID=A0A1J9QWA4_9PEZI|nr:uncharacterized protein BKCO1_3200042 [Diplodia corticola]OJD33262.1 hypothetical protein BKCO1_3200042 [Diplodia corticola]
MAFSRLSIDPRRNTVAAINHNAASAPPGLFARCINNNAPIMGNNVRPIFGSAPAASTNNLNHMANGSITAEQALPSLDTGGGNRSVTIRFGPSDRRDRTLMPASMTSKLPKSVLATIMKSSSKTQTDLGDGAILLEFTASKWCKNLTRLRQFLQTGEYAPWDGGAELEIVDPVGNKAIWESWMSAASDIHDAKTTETTHRLFLEELMLYNWAAWVGFTQLQEHSFRKLQNNFPILADEALALVDFCCPETNGIQTTEEMKTFARDVIARNKKTMVLLDNFREVFQKAIKDNFPATLLEEAQHDLVTYLRDVQTMTETTPSSTGHFLLQPKTLELYINSGALCKAARDGYGTLLPSKPDHLGRPTRNKDFHFVKDELLILRSECRTFNPPQNVVVENLQGQRGDMLKELLAPLDLNLPPRLADRFDMGVVSLPDLKLAQQVPIPTGPKVKTEHPASSSGSRGRNHSRERKKRKYHSRSRSRSRGRSSNRDRRHPERWSDPYGRR